MRKGYNPQFAENYAAAYALYKQGEFAEAHAKLNEGLKINPKDGPSKTLIEVIEEHDKQAPRDWKGYRALTSK